MLCRCSVMGASVAIANLKELNYEKENEIHAGYL